MNHRSLAFRLTLWFTLLLGATFALVGMGMFYGLEQYLHTSLRDSLRRRSSQIEQILEQGAAVISSAQISDAITTRVSPEFNNRFVRVTRAPGTLIYRSAAPADRSFDPGAVPPVAATWPQDAWAQRTATWHNQRLMVNASRIDTPSGRYLVELGSSLQSIDSLQDRLLALLGLLLPVLVICAGGGGYLLVNWALRPVDRMSQSAEHMSMQNLDARLAVLPTGDALQRLSLSLNHMLARLRDSVQISRRFLADASHELRTPLTVIKGELQEIVSGDARGEVRERIGSVLEEVARLEHLVSGLLALSRLDAGEAQREWLEVDLVALSASTAEQMRLMAEDRGIQLQFPASTPMLVRGDPSRLRQVIVNLLDNAIRFTPRGGLVTLRTGASGDDVVLEVLDTGIGIPPAALTRVFDRFYRVDEARSRDDGGAGLGLSIAQSICVAHGAHIEVRSELGHGSCFRLRFPRSAASPARAAAPLTPPMRCAMAAPVDVRD